VPILHLFITSKGFHFISSHPDLLPLEEDEFSIAYGTINTSSP
jgi:hypothetical protein